MPRRPKVTSLELVREFHETFGHPVEPEPTESTFEYRVLRLALIAEELAELAQSLGIGIDVEVAPAIPKDMVEAPKRVHNGYRRWVTVNTGKLTESKVDLVGVADALADLDYVVQGSNLTFGIPADKVMAEVHRSNMSKLGEDGKPIYDSLGKVVKGPNYSEPDLHRMIMRPHAPKRRK